MSSYPPFACRLSGFSGPERARHSGLIEQLQPALEEVRELSDGYAYRFADDGSLFARLAEWIRLESICCPFLHFELKVERRGGPVWLRLTGGDGAKEFLKSQFPVTLAR